MPRLFQTVLAIALLAGLSLAASHGHRGGSATDSLALHSASSGLPVGVAVDCAVCAGAGTQTPAAGPMALQIETHGSRGQVPRAEWGAADAPGHSSVAPRGPPALG